MSARATASLRRWPAFLARRKRCGRPALLVCVVILLAATVLWLRRPASIVSALCEAGLPNFSKPDRLPADAVHCVALGPKESISGTIMTSDHGSSLGVPSHAKPIALWFDRGSPAITQQIMRSWRQYCINGATVTLTGWRTESGGPFGETGFAYNQFFVDTVEAVGPLPPDIIAQAGPDPMWCREE